MKLRTVIVDDECLALDLLQSILSEIPDIDIVAQCGSGSEAISAIQSTDVDLMFLDVQMPEVDGFGVLKALPEERRPIVIFASAHAEYAVNAFENDADDYILKPLNEERVLKAVEKARKHRQLIEDLERQDWPVEKARGKADPRNSLADIGLAIKDIGRTEIVLKSDIVWVEASGDYSIIHTAEKTHIMRSSLSDVEGKLPSNMFRRVHRSAIINLTAVREIISLPKGEAIVRLIDGAQVKVSRSFKDVLKHLSQV